MMKRLILLVSVLTLFASLATAEPSSEVAFDAQTMALLAVNVTVRPGFRMTLRMSILPACARPIHLSNSRTIRQEAAVAET